MTNRPPLSAEEIPAALIEDVCARLAADQPVQYRLPGGGRLNIDRLLPFLCVYRRDPRRPDSGTRTLVNGEAAYLNAPGDAPVRKGLRHLVKRIAETASAKFGAFLILEIWSAPDAAVPRLTHQTSSELLLPAPGFRILERAPNRPGDTVNTLAFALQRLRIHRRDAEVQIQVQGRVHPPGSQPLLTLAEARKINCFMMGLEILPIYRDGEAGKIYPPVLRQLHRGLGSALKKAFFTFSLERTNVRPQHFYALGRRALEKRIWDIDRQLSDIGAQFNFLWQVTPINAESAWHEFKDNGFEQTPQFQYRPLEVDPLLLKRQLNLIPTEKLVDATLGHLFRQTQDELDRLATLMSDIGRRRFLAGSLQVYGAVEPKLLALANEILNKLPSQRTDEVTEQQVDARTFARRAASEIRAYRRQHPKFQARAEVRTDMFSGLMASHGRLLIGSNTLLPAQRVDALLAHEVGTHLVTYYNGREQPLRLLATGLAGYDAFQEGLAVLSEYLVGGLSRERLRLLAARVLAAHSLVAGVGFIETYRLLSDQHGFSERTAYTVTLRVFRGGGLTKDAVYLRGLVEILEYLRGGGDLEPLFVGKMAVDHVPVVSELLHREVLRPPPLTPLYMGRKQTRERLERLRKGASVLDLLP